MLIPWKNFKQIKREENKAPPNVVLPKCLIKLLSSLIMTLHYHKKYYLLKINLAMFVHNQSYWLEFLVLLPIPLLCCLIVCFLEDKQNLE